MNAFFFFKPKVVFQSILILFHTFHFVWNRSTGRCVIIFLPLLAPCTTNQLIRPVPAVAKLAAAIVSLSMASILLLFGKPLIHCMSKELNSHFSAYATSSSQYLNSNVLLLTVCNFLTCCEYLICAKQDNFPWTLCRDSLV